MRTDLPGEGGCAPGGGAGTPGASGVRWRYGRRGPSDEKVSTGLVPPPTNGPEPAVATLTAATPKASATVLWPLVWPAVASCSLPRMFATRR